MKLTQKTKRLLFYIAMITLPLIQFCIFYIGVNINSILISFKSYQFVDGVYVETWTGFENFKNVIHDIMFDSLGLTALANSLYLWLAGLGTMFLSLIFSFYIVKKMPGSELFKVLLFLPSIIPVMVSSIVFNFFVERAVPDVLLKLFQIKITPPLSNLSTIFPSRVLLTVWCGFGTNVLMYVGAISRIPVEITEYVQIDGASKMREFFSITLPLIFPTISTFLVIGIAGIFTNQANLYNFFQYQADRSTYTLGYWMFVLIAEKSSNLTSYPYAAAMGVLLAMIAAPVTLVVRWLLEKFGPTTSY